MMHNKTVVVDGQWSVVGSANMDIRSKELNQENVARDPRRRVRPPARRDVPGRSREGEGDQAAGMAPPRRCGRGSRSGRRSCLRSSTDARRPRREHGERAVAALADLRARCGRAGSGRTAWPGTRPRPPRGRAARRRGRCGRRGRRRGWSRSRGCADRLAIAVHPSIEGSERSITITSGRNSRAIATASPPSAGLVARRSRPRAGKTRTSRASRRRRRRGERCIASRGTTATAPVIIPPASRAREDPRVTSVLQEPRPPVRRANVQEGWGRILHGRAPCAMNSMKILIIDDDGDTRELVQMSLALARMETITASSGAEGVAKAAREQPGRDPPRRDDAVHGRTGHPARAARRSRGPPTSRSCSSPPPR